MSTSGKAQSRGFRQSTASASLVRFQDAIEQIHRYVAFHAVGQPIPSSASESAEGSVATSAHHPLQTSPLSASFAAVGSWYGFPSGGGFRPPLTRPNFLPDFLGTGNGTVPLRAGRRSPVRLPLHQVAGRVLASEIRAERDQPPFARATRDGFACRAAEANAHQFLLLAASIRAGQHYVGALRPGEACEIMTGAPVPAGADAVLMVEHCEQESNCVRLAEEYAVSAGENIVTQGAEARMGDVLVPPGSRLQAHQIALAAQHGYRDLAVSPRPRVAILTTGDELVSLTQQPGPAQIRNSNAPMLAALVTAMGGDPVVLPTAADSPEALDDCLRQAMDSDLLLLSGGISVGRFDLVEAALTRAGARFFFGRVAIQPGKPVAFGQFPRTAGDSEGDSLPFLALPGNPISTAVTFQLFAAPLLAGLAGCTEVLPRFALAQFTGKWQGRPGLTRFLPAACDFSASPQVRLVPWQGSGDLAALARSNCFVAIAEEANSIDDGSIVSILLI